METPATDAASKAILVGLDSALHLSLAAMALLYLRNDSLHSSGGRDALSSCAYKHCLCFVCHLGDIRRATAPGATPLNAELQHDATAWTLLLLLSGS